MDDKNGLAEYEDKPYLPQMLTNYATEPKQISSHKHNPKCYTKCDVLDIEMKNISLKYSIRIKNVVLKIQHIPKAELIDVSMYDSIAESFDDQMQHLADKLHIEES